MTKSNTIFFFFSNRQFEFQERILLWVKNRCYCPQLVTIKIIQNNINPELITPIYYV